MAMAASKKATRTTKTATSAKSARRAKPAKATKATKARKTVSTRKAAKVSRVAKRVKASPKQATAKTPKTKKGSKAPKKAVAPARRIAEGNGRAALVESLAKRLDEQRREILHLYRHDLGVGLDAFRDGDDEIDRANFDSDRDLALSLSDSERDVLLQIEDALRRIGRGEYGSCTSCTKPIADQRLRAIPWARYCIDCQELEEKGLLG
jgi:DnaK suppressor protein